MLLISVFVALTLLYTPIVNAITIHETCKSMTGVAEYGYGPDVSYAITTAYQHMQTIAKNAANVATKYRANELPPNERARISALLTAFGIPNGDKRQSLFLYQLESKDSRMTSAAFWLALTHQLRRMGTFGKQNLPGFDDNLLWHA